MKIQIAQNFALVRASVVVTVLLIGVCSAVTPVRAAAVAPPAQDKAAARALERSNIRSTQQATQNTRTVVPSNPRANSAVDEAQDKQLCVNRERTLRNKVSAYGKAAEIRQKQLDAKLQRIIALSDKYNLNTPDIDNLIIAARLVSSRELQPAIANIQKLPETAPIDCSSPSVATSLSAIKVTTNETKDALNEYRQSIKAIALALQNKISQQASQR
ncbi:hypothetical protein KDA06_01180 [Candidatus Saccharibacteria bacterium]|nr:hypothetical protein [Candidatus Saccharibacteria bacterium]